MKNDIKMVAYGERDSHGSREDKTLTHDEDGGWRVVEGVTAGVGEGGIRGERRLR